MVLTPFTHPRTADRVLVIVHAISLAASAYRSIAMALPAGFRTYGLDMAGHGRAAAVTDEDPWDAMTEGVSTSIRHLVESTALPIYAFAHSGGASAVVLAQQAADLGLAGAVLYEPALRPQVAAAPPRAMVARTLKRRAQFASRSEAADYLGERRPYSSFTREVLDGFLEDGLVDTETGVSLACTPSVEAAIYESVTTRDGWGALSDFSVPTLLLRGDQDPSPSLGSLVPDMAVQLPRAEVTTVTDAGHFGPCEVPTQVANLIDQFIGSVREEKP